MEPRKNKKVKHTVTKEIKKKAGKTKKESKKTVFTSPESAGCDWIGSFRISCQADSYLHYIS